jgi:hypothetical protein
MKIRTKVDVTYNSVGKVKGTETGILEGHIINTVWLNNFSEVGANYVYAKPDGTVVSKDAFSVKDEEVEVLYDAIKADIPTDKNHRETEEIKYYLAFIIEMAKTFELDASEIELVP